MTTSPEGYTRLQQYIDTVEASTNKDDASMTMKKAFLEDPWLRVLMARHPQRPRAQDYIKYIFSDFQELSGERMGQRSNVLRAGIGRLGAYSVMVIAQNRGSDLASNLECNFGMVDPAGYRFSQRVMKLAEKWQIPLVTLIDSPGADASVEAETGNQSAAISQNLLLMAELRIPTIAVITGEGMSGGAMALALCDRILMMEHAIFSVISPEGCAAILWRDAARAPLAARQLQLDSESMMRHGLIDAYVKEPHAGAQSAPDEAAQELSRAITQEIIAIGKQPIDKLLRQREKKWLAVGSL